MNNHDGASPGMERHEVRASGFSQWSARGKLARRLRLTTLPKPEYREGDYVQFVRDECCARDGVVRRVLLQGGSYGPLEDRGEVMRLWYLDAEHIASIVTARGHDHRIKACNSVGRFVSLERISNIFPPHE